MTTIGPGTPVIYVGGAPHDAAADVDVVLAALTDGALYFVREVIDRGPAHCPRCGSTDFLAIRGRDFEYSPCLFKPLNDGEPAKAVQIAVGWGTFRCPSNLMEPA